jgi:O-antigen/teichoic acid export membrane protein
MREENIQLSSLKEGNVVAAAEPVKPPDLEPQPPASLSGHAVRGGVVIGSSQLVRIAVQMLSVVVLSRMLLPEDFGLVAAVTPVIGFISMFQDLGYGQAIIQRKNISNEQISAVFWTTAALGLLCASAVILISPAVAWFFHDRRLLLITISASAPILLGSLMSVPSGLLNRHLNFRGLAVADALGAVAGLVSAVIAALLGARYWSLMISSAVSSIVIVTGYWINARWRPDRPRRFVDREIGAFGAHLTGFTFVNYFARNLDNILIGHKAGSVQLGYYDRAYKLLYFPIQNINGPLYRVMTPLLSRVQDDKQRFREMFLRSTGQLTLFIVPGMAALVAVSHEFVALVFGPRWEPVAPIFLYLGINGLLQPLGNATGWIFIAQGRTDVMFRVGVVTSLITVASFFVGLNLGGAVGLAAAYAFVEYFLKSPIQYAVLHRLGPVRASDLCWQQFPLLVAAGATFAIVQFLLRGSLGMNGVPLIVMAVLISYASALAITSIRPGGRAVLAESKRLAGTVWNRARIYLGLSVSSLAGECN